MHSQSQKHIYEIQPIPIITVKMTNLKNTKRKINLIIMRYGTQQYCSCLHRNYIYIAKKIVLRWFAYFIVKKLRCFFTNIGTEETVDMHVIRM